MNPDTSPFTPGRPVAARYFVGRREEVYSLSALATKAAKQNYLTMGYVCGERGVGKSSLVVGVRNALESNENIVGAHINLDGVSTVEEAVAATYEGILEDNYNRQWWEKLKAFFGNINEVQVNHIGGIKFFLPARKRTTALGFVDGLRSLLDGLGDECRGLFLVWDDINGLATNPDFANWLKSLSDVCTVNNRDLRASLVLVGLEERRRQIIRNNDSVKRIFEIIDLHPWTREESCDFFRRSFGERNAVIGESAINRLADVCGGLPMLAHEAGDAVWRCADNENIQSSAISRGVLKAADIVGDKWLQSQVVDALKGEHYISILRCISGADVFKESRDGLSFSKSAVASKLSAEERRHLDNFLQRMKKLGAIISVPGRSGVYQFPNALYRFYFLQQPNRKRQK